jgi:hypothetical protein
MHVISDKDADELTSANLTLDFKILHSALLRVFYGFQGRRQRIFGFSHDGKLQLLLFVVGVYMDTASHNVVMDAYSFEVTPDYTATQSKLRADERLDIKEVDVPARVFDVWKSALPAMAERCRSWEHKGTCEYKIELHSVCSCGIGKVQPDFLQEWAEFAPKVVRCAVSPLLPEPFIEQTREQLLSKYHASVAKLRRNIDSNNKPCAACGSITATKCGRCNKVYYCGKECQRRDWKSHKRECR